jgi:phospholipase C
LPAPEQSGIEHIVVVMMENRSFDHLLGWLPNANGRQAGLSYADRAGVLHSTYRLTTFTGCGHPDPDHSYPAARSEYDNGKMDGWLRTTTNDSFCIGYYAEQDLPFFSALARNYTTLDNSFPSILGPTFPNRIFSHAAQTDRLDDSTGLTSVPTIWDALANAGVSHRYYFSNVPFLALWGAKYITISGLFAEFLSDAATGNLPAVSFLDPAFTIVDLGEGNDDHPHADMRAGEAFLQQVFNAVSQGPDWDKTVLVINRDEWGGFFEHVVPPRVIAPNQVDPDLVDGKALLGCRVPVLVVSPFTRGNPLKPRINSLVYDHTSALKLIEWRWNLAPLTARDASDEINNLAHALDFHAPDTSVPALPQVTPPLPAPCGQGGILSSGGGTPTEFSSLLNSGLAAGWPLPTGLP